MKTVEKIANGTIKIENGRLVGLGGTDCSISIDKLNELMNFMDKHDVVEALNTTITNIGLIFQDSCCYDATDNEELKKFIQEELRPRLISIDMYDLNEISKCFND